MNNRRNYYRILHVQPEAPVEIIKASYRSLMTKLNGHPDRGGSHESAVLINQAYAVLSDPQRRKKYDEMLLSRHNNVYQRPVNEAYSHSKPSTSANQHTHRSEKENVKSGPTNARRSCFFCGTEHSAYVNKHCIRCESPLASIQSGQNNRRGELIGRRTAPRITKAGTLTLYPDWPHSGYHAQLKDLSTTGLSLLTTYAGKTGQILKFNSNFLNGVARVVTVRENNSVFTIHVNFLAAEFVTKSGVFVTEKA